MRCGRRKIALAVPETDSGGQCECQNRDRTSNRTGMVRGSKTSRLLFGHWRRNHALTVAWSWRCRRRDRCLADRTRSCGLRHADKRSISLRRCLMAGVTIEMRLAYATLRRRAHEVTACALVAAAPIGWRAGPVQHHACASSTSIR